jgi:hypothetical protein
VEGIGVGKAFVRLHLLHATQFGSGRGVIEYDTQIAEYAVVVVRIDNAKVGDTPAAHFGVARTLEEK